MANIFQINKGINKSIQFKGIKAQYILYLAIVLVVLLLCFGILYLVGLNAIVCLCIIIPTGALSIMKIQHLSNKYGEHGLLKKGAQAQLPTSIISQSTHLFQFKSSQP